MPIEVKRRSSALGAMLLCAVVGSCETTTAPRGPATQLQVQPPNPNVIVGESLQLVATLRDEAGRPHPLGVVTWQSADPSIATVSEDGLVMGARTGATRITGTGGGVTGAIEVTVLSAPELPASLHMCAIDDAGVAWCWGRGFAGQIGDGNHANRPDPVALSEVPTEFSHISVGWAHTCAVETSPAEPTWCWGRGDDGRLGTGAVADEPRPVRTSDPLNYVGVASGGRHTCGWRVGGRVACWGDNSRGQLGLPGGVAVSTSVNVDLFARVVTAGGQHTCAIEQTTRAAYCWGRNDAAQLGVGDRADRDTPTVVEGGHAYRSISAGPRHTCGVLVGGDAVCWGSGVSGQLGNGEMESTLGPVLVAGEHEWLTISAGGSHTCGVQTDGAVLCWGSNTYGQLGTGDTRPSGVPVAVAGAGSYTDVSAGHDFTCGLSSDGAVHCWGANQHGQLGAGDVSVRLMPAPIATTASFDALASH